MGQVQARDLEHGTGGKNQAGGDDTGQEFSSQQNLAANGREKIIVQAAIQDFATKQVHEDAEAPEENGQPQIEKLEDSGEDVGVLAEIAGTMHPDFHNRFAGEKNHRQERQQVDPESALRKKCFPHLQPQDGQYLCDPKRIHRPASSEPIRYSYTEFTSSSAGATDSMVTPFWAMWFSRR